MSSFGLFQQVCIIDSYLIILLVYCFFVLVWILNFTGLFLFNFFRRLDHWYWYNYFLSWFGFSASVDYWPDKIILKVCFLVRAQIIDAEVIIMWACYVFCQSLYYWFWGYNSVRLFCVLFVCGLWFWRNSSVS